MCGVVSVWLCFSEVCTSDLVFFFFFFNFTSTTEIYTLSLHDARPIWLELSDTENPLETGVSIMVRPPGKRFQNMDLLSGGEKALTAVALIFSIFLINPSPFCLLDEVDAPLDDSNLARFNKMLRKLSQKTQFLVVTHNKMSMEEADALFGVTMEEPGASKVVSVKFVD